MPMSDEYNRDGYWKRPRKSIIPMLFAFAFMLFLCEAITSTFEILPWQQVRAETLAVTAPVCGEWDARTERLGEEGLRAIAALSPTNIWVVGGRHEGALIQHWDGNTWHNMDASSYLSGANVVLRGIAAISANDIWAVGDAPQPGGWRSFIIHWDGTNWSPISTPNPGQQDSRLNAISAFSKDNVWAVGEYSQSDSISRPLILHWDGTQWTQITDLDSTTHDGTLRSVVAIAPDNVWAAGSTGKHDLDPLLTLTVHWNGKQWSAVQSPSPGKASNVLRGITAVTKDDIWAVGEYKDDTDGNHRMLVLHWNGKAWVLNLGPQLASDNESRLSGILALSKNDVWAVGGYNATNNVKQEAVVLHWDGVQWNIIPNPQLRFNQYLRSIAAISGNEILAVGASGNDDCEMLVCPAYYTLMARFTRTTCAKTN